MTWQLPQTIPKRYILSLLAFFGFFNAYVLRSNLSIAIIAMVRSRFDSTKNSSSIVNKTKMKMKKLELNVFFSSLDRLRLEYKNSRLRSFVILLQLHSRTDSRWIFSNDSRRESSFWWKRRYLCSFDTFDTVLRSNGTDDVDYVKNFRRS